MRSIFERCQDEDVEYCGPICVQRDRVTCQVGPPAAKRDRKGECSWERCSDPDTSTVGIYHCHGANRDYFVDELFSTLDTMQTTRIFLVTPTGVMKKHVPYLGAIEIGRIDE